MMLSGTSRRSHAIQALWSSLLPISVLSESHSDDEEVVKLALLLKSLQVLVTGLRQKQLLTAAQLQSKADELESIMVKKVQFESETMTLRKDLSAMKFELQSAEAKAKKFQTEAEAAKAKCERLQSKIVSEVEVRLHNMFKNCLQQNKAATVLDMMTQMYQETQAAEAECLDGKNPGAELPVKDRQSGKSPAEKQAKQSKMFARHRHLQKASPDTSLILATPESNKCAAKGRKELIPQKNELLTLQSISTTPHSVPSSPDVIAGTPPSTEKKNLKKSKRKRNFFNSDVAESNTGDEIERKAIVYAKDTQDLDEVPSTALRSALRENAFVPETLIPDSYEKEMEMACSMKKNKEDDASSPGSNNHQRRSIADLSTDVEFPSTPKKASKSRESSPVLGNSANKKNSSRSSSSSTSGTSSSNSSLKKNWTKSSSAVNASISILTTASGQCRKSVQPHITRFTTDVSRSNKLNRSNNKLSLKRDSQQRDVSKCFELKRKQSVAADLSMHVSHLTEEEQVEMAISNSMKENFPEGLHEDSDATVFIPPSPCPGKNGTVQEMIKQAGNTTPLLKRKQDSKPSFKAFFEPMFASTEREVTPTKQKYPSNSLRANLVPSASQFNPPVASTEKELTENSALHDLTELMDTEALKDAAPGLPDTSYDHLPIKSTSPGYKYQRNAVRNKNERMNLPGVECTQCNQYFEAAFGSDDPKAKKIILNSCSRHRDLNGPRPGTPENYWDPGWTSPEMKKCQEECKVSLFT